MAFFSIIRLWPLLLSIVFGIFVGLAGYTANYAEGLSYLSNDPKACVNCHIMREQYDGWEKASHHAVATCNDCHTPHQLIPKYLSKMQNGYRHSSAFTLQNFPEPIRITAKNKAILLENCVGCHSGLASMIASHDDQQQPLDCIHCHTDVGHGPKQ
jgi:cytochrome c nitrite reductase small subunit